MNTNGIPNATYEWSADNGQSQAYSSVNSFVFNTNAVGSGNITIKGKAINTGSVNNRCESTQTIPYIISKLELNPDGIWESMVCKNSSTSFTVDTAGTGNLNGAQCEIIWERKPASSNTWEAFATNTLSQTVTPLEPTNYRVTAQLKKNNIVFCTKQITHALDVIVVNMGDAKTYETCINQPIELTGYTSNGTSWHWEDASGNVQGSSLSLTVTPATNSVYYFVAKLGTCTNRQTHTIDVYNLQLSINSGDFSVCPGNMAPLEADTTGTGKIKNLRVSWQKQGESQLLSSNLAGTLVTKDYPKETTVYTVTASNNACEKSASITVSMYPVPAISEILEIGPKMAQIEAYGGVPTYEYAIDDTTFFYNEKIFERLWIGSHTAYVKDQNNCINSKAFFTNEVMLEFPKYFMPNNEERWVIKNLDAYNNVNLRIYDRFGREIINITSSDPSRAWNGKNSSGKLLRSDDYWYTLYIEETKREFTGHFTLLNTPR
jgi:gliding motility-associated-like protein